MNDHHLKLNSICLYAWMILSLVRNATSQVTWDPPAVLGNISDYQIKIHNLAEPSTDIRTFTLPSNDPLPFILPGLTPGASYTLELYSTLEDRDNLVPVVQNFTARPNSPGRTIVWFRNETTLLLLWQPPHPVGIFSHYKVSLDPPDAVESTLEVEKAGDPPEPAQAPFYGLFPGRNYNLSLQTVSNGEVSRPTFAQYRTVPLRPRNVTFELVTSDSFQVRWDEPNGASEFDRYRVSDGNNRHPAPIIVRRDDTRVALFNESIEPGRTYRVLVKTLSGNVASWPATVNITTKPLPVQNLTVWADTPEGGDLVLAWSPDVRSQQDSYRIIVHDNGAEGTSGVITTSNNEFVATNLLPGRNYSLSVVAVMNGIESDPAVLQAKRASSL